MTVGQVSDSASTAQISAARVCECGKVREELGENNLIFFDDCGPQALKREPIFFLL